ncbi:MAG: hypothetical protein Q4F38_09065, partial [Akkermansia sp.]|nr:hypothetical protein [Akkermansia sp.]
KHQFSYHHGSKPPIVPTRVIFPYPLKNAAIGIPSPRFRVIIRQKSVIFPSFFIKFAKKCTKKSFFKHF